MKKILAFLIVTVMLLASLPLAISAAPLASDFVPGSGFYVYGPTFVKGEKDVPTITQTSDGVTVTHGGYYWEGKDYGGIFSAQKVDLNGFEVTVRLDKVHTSDDCWFAFDFLAAQRGFYTDKFNVETGNQGMLNLIRQDRGTFSAMDGLTSFSSKKTVTNDLFKFKAGDVVTLTVNRVDYGNYTYTFKKAGVADPVVIDYEYPMDDLFRDGKAYFSLSASSKTSVADDFIYTIVDVKNGTPMTPTERAAIDVAKFAKDSAAIIQEANGRVNNAKITVEKSVARAQATGDIDAIAKANEAAAKLTAAKTRVDSGTFSITEIRTLCTEATQLAYDANKLSAAAEKAAEDATDTDTEAQTEAKTEAETKAQTEAQTKAPVADKDGGFPGWAIALIIGGVAVVAVVVILVVVRKKKQA